MYLKIDEGFTAHPKTLRFARLMQNPEAPWFMLRLWTWACRAAPDGDLTQMESYDIEQAVSYRALDGKCYRAMVDAGFIDELANGRKEIHNWAQRTGGDITDMEAEAERKRIGRRHRMRKCDGPDAAEPCPICVREMSGGRPADILGTSGGPAAEKPTQARQGQARPDQAKQDPDPDPRPDVPTPAPARDPVVLVLPAPTDRCTGYDLMRWYGDERAKAIDGVLPWRTPGDADGKASSFATSLTAAELADVRPTMALHLADLKAGKGRMGALENPTFGFGCWRGDFTALRERLHGKTPTAAGPPPADRPCDHHTRGQNSGRRAPKHESSKACAECRHLAALSRAPPAAATEASTVGELMDGMTR